MIAANFRRYPEALAMQLPLEFACVVVRRMRHTAAEARRSHARAAVVPDREPESIPVGSIVRTPTGKEAKVLGYRGKRRDHIVRLWCQYLRPDNKRHDKVLLAAKLLVVVNEEKI